MASAEKTKLIGSTGNIVLIRKILLEFGLQALAPVTITALFLSMFWVFSWMMLGPVIIPLEIAQNRDMPFLLVFLLWNGSIILYCLTGLGTFLYLERRNITDIDGLLGRCVFQVVVATFIWAVYVSGIS